MMGTCGDSWGWLEQAEVMRLLLLQGKNEEDGGLDHSEGGGWSDLDPF